MLSNRFETNFMYGERLWFLPMEEHFRHKVNYRLLYMVDEMSIK